MMTLTILRVLSPVSGDLPDGMNVELRFSYRILMTTDIVPATFGWLQHGGTEVILFLFGCGVFLVSPDLSDIVGQVLLDTAGNHVYDPSTSEALLYHWRFRCREHKLDSYLQGLRRAIRLHRQHNQLDNLSAASSSSRRTSVPDSSSRLSRFQTKNPSFLFMIFNPPVNAFFQDVP